MSTVPIHHSSEHAAGPGSDLESNHREGQPKDRCGAQVSDTITQKVKNIPNSSMKYKQKDLIK